jgi:hypothetical protein
MEKEKKVMEKNYKPNNRQIIVYNEQFLFMNQFSKNLKAIVSPWVREGDVVSSGFFVPENRRFRIEKLYTMMGNCKYTVANGEIEFDCLSKFPKEIFPEGDSGWIHFLSKTREDKDTKTVEIDDRMIITEIEPICGQLVQPSKIDFSTTTLKAFSFLMVAGFGQIIAERERAILYVTMQDIERQYCGVTNKVDLNNLIHNIIPVFPIFSINISEKKSIIFLKIDGLKNFLSTIPFKKGMLRFEYSFADTNKLHVCVVGHSED